MANKTVTGKLTYPDGTAITDFRIVATLSRSTVITGTQEIAPLEVVGTQPNIPDGTFTFTLPANNDLTPNGTFFTVAATINGTFTLIWGATIVVPQTAGPFEISTITTNPPTVSPSPSRVSTLVVDGALTGTSGPISFPSGFKVYDTGGAAINAMASKYAIKGDGQFITDGAITNTLKVLTSTSNKFVAADVGKLISVIGAGVAGVPLMTTIASYQSAGQVTLTAAASTTAAAATVFWATDDTAGLTSWIADLSASTGGFLPFGFYGLNGTLNLPASQLAIAGAGVRELWGSNATIPNAVWFPTVVPFLSGSVLWQFANVDAISSTALAPTHNLRDFGVLFTNLYNATGNGFINTPPLRLGKMNTGLVGAEWRNLTVYGHGGNYNGFVFNNPLLCEFSHLRSYGGGGIKIRGEGSNNYGNSVFIDPFSVTFTAGTEDGLNLAGDNPQNLNLLAFIRQQSATIAPSPALPGNVAVTGAQKLVNTNNSVVGVYFLAPDWETNVASGVTFPVSGVTYIGNLGGASVPVSNALSAYNPGDIVAVISGSAAQSADILQVRPRGTGDTNKVVIDKDGKVILTNGLAVAAGSTQIASNNYPTTGAGIEMQFYGAGGAIQSYDRGAAAWRVLNIVALSVALGGSGTEKFKVDATGIGFYAHATVAQPAAPVTLADVIAIIRGNGLSA